MSQLAALVVDIITGSSTVQSCQTAASEESFWGVELGRLQSALEILTVAEKQLRHSSDRSTCFTAALLQLASCNNTDLTFSSSSRSSKNADKLSTEPQDEAKRKELNQTNSAPYPRFPAERSIDNASFKDDGPCKIIRCMSPEKLDVIWQKCIERCHSKTLKKLLVSHGRLVSITEVEGVLIVYIAFGNVREKARAERFLNSITNSIEVVLRQNVEVRIGIVPESYLKALNSLPESPIEKMELATIYSSSENGGNGGFPNMLRKGIDDSEAFLLDDSLHRRSSLGLETNRKLIESTGIQSAKNGERNESRLEKTPPLDCQILQQHKASLIQAMSLKQWEPDMVNEIEEVGIDGSHCLEDRGLEKGLEWHNNLSSPSVFHGSCLKGNSDKYALGYESGYIRPRFCCWRISKARGKMIKQGGYARKQKDGCLQCLK
ncbi:hypothetical protein AXF42_Ash019041 [Apostasia shenzhenica]|uniref:STICHEL DnaA-N-like alpha-beta domain-containing protein n=1 Tax=Apostasia shenzhenica TaxID=1088818 RepID=A0A2I0BB85_9ASPA|nr:hypothetical protein AXF42_Ash019041 [Apostasia shenzhenica]